jgi:subtilisin family serine protease
MPQAWSITQGSSSILVCVIDTGIDYDHPDLAPNMATGTDTEGRSLRTGYNAITGTNDAMDDNRCVLFTIALHIYFCLCISLERD